VVEFLTSCAVVLAGLGGVAAAVLGLRRLTLARAEQRRLDAEKRLLPAALELLDGMEPVGEVSEQDVDVFAALLGRFGRLVRGVESDRIAEFFEHHGWVDYELARLNSRRPWRRATAAFALGDMGSSRAIPDLIERLQDSEPDVRAAGARSLGRLGATDAVEPLVDGFAANRLPRSVAGQALLSIGSSAVRGLRVLNEAEGPVARAFAVELIGLLGDASDEDVLVERLRDTSAEVRAKAARALGRLGAEGAMLELAERLDDHVVFVRAAAATALAAVGDHRVVARLVALAQQDEFEAARAAAEAAAHLDPEGVKRASAAAGAAAHLNEAADRLAVYA
jgi:HEAT repeat protein